MVDRLITELGPTAKLWVSVGDQWVGDVNQLLKNHCLQQRQWLIAHRRASAGGKRHLLYFARSESAKERIARGGDVRLPAGVKTLDDRVLSKWTRGTELPEFVIRRIVEACVPVNQPFMVLSNYRMAVPTDLGWFPLEHRWLWRERRGEAEEAVRL